VVIADNHRYTREDPVARNNRALAAGDNYIGGIYYYYYKR
jgi:hypothetical protein